MKMYLGNTAVNSMKVGTNTDDATLVASDLQSGVSGYARGKKVIGTGKAFSFASYGTGYTNVPIVIPNTINTIYIGSLQYPTRMIIGMNDMFSIDFSASNNVAEITIDGIVYPITMSVQNGMLTLACDKTINIEMFYGRDEYA